MIRVLSPAPHTGLRAFRRFAFSLVFPADRLVIWIRSLIRAILPCAFRFLNEIDMVLFIKRLTRN